MTCPHLKHDCKQELHNLYNAIIQRITGNALIETEHDENGTKIRIRYATVSLSEMKALYAAHYQRCGHGTGLPATIMGGQRGVINLGQRGC